MAYESYGQLDYGYAPGAYKSSAGNSYPYLQKGDKDQPKGSVPVDGGVAAWQQALSYAGLAAWLGSAGIDGDFGSKTRDATKQFQKNNGLSVTGKVGPKEWEKYLSRNYVTHTGAAPTTISSYTPSTAVQQAAAQAPIATQAGMFSGGLKDLTNQPWFYPVATVAMVGTMVLILKQIKK